LGDRCTGDAHVADEDEMRSGQRREGAFFELMP